MKFIITILLCFSFVENIAAQNLLIPYRRDSLWGYANEEGKIVVEPEYFNTRFFYDGKYSFIEKVHTDGKLIYGIVRNNGKILLEPKYSNIAFLKNIQFDFNKLTYSAKYYINTITDNFNKYNGSNFFVTTSYENGFRQNLLDSNAKIILEDVKQIRIVKIFLNGNANLSFNRKSGYGIVNLKGDIILKPIYDYVDYLSASNDKDLMIVTKDGAMALLDAKGNALIPLKKQVIKEFESGNEQALFKVMQNEKTAVYDATGKILSPFTTKKVYVTSTTKNGKEKLKFEYYSEAFDETVQESKATEAPVEPRRSYPDEAVKNVPPPADDYKEKEDPRITYDNYIKTREFNSIKFRIINIRNEYGVINLKDSSFVIKAKYDSLYWAFSGFDSRNYIIAKRKNKVGMLDVNGKILIPFDYKNIQTLENNNFEDRKKAIFIATYKDNIQGLVDQENNIVKPFNYLSLQYISREENYNYVNEFIVKNKEGLYGLLNSNGETLIPESYTNLYNTYDNYLTKNVQYYYVKNKENKYGIISRSNKFLIAILYDSILYCNGFYEDSKLSSFENAAFCIMQNGKYGMVTKNGYLIKPIANEPLFLLSQNLLDSNIYFVGGDYNNQSLYNDKKGLLINAFKGFNFTAESYKYNNDYKNGILLYKENSTGLYGVVLNNTNLEIIPAKYNYIWKMEFKIPLKNTIFYGMRNYNSKTTEDIITNTGIKFFEDTVK